jgi:hypothetical protein
MPFAGEAVGRRLSRRAVTSGVITRLICAPPGPCSSRGNTTSVGQRTYCGAMGS